MGGRIGSGGRKVHSRSFYFRFRRYTAPVAYIGTLKGVRVPRDPQASSRGHPTTESSQKYHFRFVYQPVYLTSHVPNYSKCTKTYQGWCQACKTTVASVTVPNVTGVPNVTSTPNVPKMPKNHSRVPKMYKRLLGVLIGVVYQLVYQTSQAPKCTKCTKTHQGLCLACKKSATSVTVPNVTGVPNVTSTQNVPKMTKNHCSVPKMCRTSSRCTNSVY